VINKGDKSVALSDWRIKYYSALISKRCVNERPGVNLSQNQSNGNH